MFLPPPFKKNMHESKKNGIIAQKFFGDPKDPFVCPKKSVFFYNLMTLGWDDFFHLDPERVWILGGRVKKSKNTLKTTTIQEFHLPSGKLT